MEYLRCVVERITYQNEQNGYTVLKCSASRENGLVTVVGTLPQVHVGAVLSLEGSWTVDPRYGRQFSAEKAEVTLPATVYGIEKYLGSGLIKGVGPKFARRIVQKFGEDTLAVIEEDPDRLLAVEGIGKVRVDRIKKSWQEQKEIKNIMLFLQSHGVSTAHATKIFKTYGADSVAVVQDNPYRLAEDIWGIGFKTADRIAEKLGMEKHRFVRLRSGLLYTLNRLSESGHVYAVREQLLEAAVGLLDVEEGFLAQTLDEMLRTKDLFQEKEAIYLPLFYFAECGCAKRLLSLMEGESTVLVRAKNTDALMNAVQARAVLAYDEVQLAAIRTAVSSKVMVLTGGPGTGKTTTTLGILSACRLAGCRVVLAAPTGRAAKRLSETAGLEAKTLHRLLEYKPAAGYQKNEDNPLDGDVLIVDECSMIDLLLMYSLLKAIPSPMSLILVGDIDQLPSVGAGNVLRDIIASGQVPVVRLTWIFRQAQGSRIIMNAHRINRGQRIDMSGGREADFFFAAQEDNDAIVETIVRYCTKNLPAYYHVDAFSDIQVLTPMQRGTCGAANLNQILQQNMNPTDIFLQRGGIQFRLHDKVMQIRNNYEKEVFNGDIGTILAVDRFERELTVNFDGREVVYDISELDELTLAYATTIHKAQGSEYPIVVIPMTMSHYVMLQRNLLYTGVTRAKKILVLVGSKKAVSYAIRNEKTSARNTMLAERLQEGSVSGIPTGNLAQPVKVTRPIPIQNTLPTERRKQETFHTPSSVREEFTYGKNAAAANAPADIFVRLSRSEFRRQFHLGANDRAYVQEKGMETIERHARDFIEKRLAGAEPPNDGKQTPFHGHPVFTAQHATATCCRSCLEKWYGIPKGRALTEAEQENVVSVIMEWIRRQMLQ